MPYTVTFLSGLQDKSPPPSVCNEVPPHAVIIRIIMARSLHARVTPIRSEPVPTRVGWFFLLYFFPARIYRHARTRRKRDERKLKRDAREEGVRPAERKRRRENIPSASTCWRASFAPLAHHRPPSLHVKAHSAK
jgi:hypothetical protein